MDAFLITFLLPGFVATIVSGTVVGAEQVISALLRHIDHKRDVQQAVGVTAVSFDYPACKGRDPSQRELSEGRNPFRTSGIVYNPCNVSPRFSMMDSAGPAGSFLEKSEVFYVPLAPGRMNRRPLPCVELQDSGQEKP